MGRGVIEPERPVKVTDLLIRQKAEAMILWAYSALRQFPIRGRHVMPFDPPAIAFWCFAVCGLMALAAQLTQWLGG